MGATDYYNLKKLSDVCISIHKWLLFTATAHMFNVHVLFLINSRFPPSFPTGLVGWLLPKMHNVVNRTHGAWPTKSLRTLWYLMLRILLDLMQLNSSSTFSVLNRTLLLISNQLCTSISNNSLERSIRLFFSLMQISVLKLTRPRHSQSVWWRGESHF